MLLVEAAGEPWVLRRYQNLTAAQVRREHALLGTLAGRGLSFEVPVPRPSRSGDTVVTAPDGLPSALFRMLPGQTLDREVPGAVHAAGAALGELDRTMAELESQAGPQVWDDVPLDRIHPAVDDLDALVVQLRAALPDHPGVEWLAGAVASTGPATAGLPRQVVHGDFAPSNVLVANGRVTAVLDFEIAGRDLRVNDVVAGVLQCAGVPEHQLFDRRVAEFHAGYAQAVDLTEQERAAVPDLIRQRTLGSAVWRAGRWRAGQSTLAQLAANLTDGRATEAHLHRYLPH